MILYKVTAGQKHWIDYYFKIIAIEKELFCFILLQPYIAFLSSGAPQWLTPLPIAIRICLPIHQCYIQNFYQKSNRFTQGTSKCSREIWILVYIVDSTILQWPHNLQVSCSFASQRIKMDKINILMRISSVLSVLFITHLQT